jgi:hypothetical protein
MKTGSRLPDSYIHTVSARIAQNAHLSTDRNHRAMQLAAAAEELRLERQETDDQQQVDELTSSALKGGLHGSKWSNKEYKDTFPPGTP